MKKFPISNFQFSKFLLTVVLVLFFLFLADQTLAICEGPIVPCGRPGTPNCQFCHLFILINNILNFILTCLAPIMAVLMFIIGGLYLLIAGGSPEKFSKAKSILTAAVIGLVIVFVAWVFLNTFLDYLGVVEWTGLMEWWKVTDKCPIY